ncbi:Na+/H+ antiporter NhaC family protein [Sedimentibacter sp. MB31-C6]|uniref:Na+/H+ antiporter NhaC family protein n=1 Tax=Sedimentibacter sp. MB31-C6 TaxID=3109366 RepID=UPI002DDD307D|nr:Na+/H+ antiporter NhaC family protein [Sedimentibacter sp. MB36-C1]WSI03592.1 Na+/H+ antiporter NhaC family protein [Sedimentibacter sp. MB36-C1]
MELKEKKLEFYGGEWISFVPFLVFLVLIITTTFHFGSISDGALWLPAFMAIVVGLFFAKNKKDYSNAIIEGMASKEAIIPIVCWLFAGVFSRILRDSGLALGIAGVAANMGVGSTAFVVITFIASAIFATATGTGFGTIATGMGVLYPAAVTLGAYPPLVAGAIISGGVFGDNLAPISDTTICSATSQGVDVPGVVRSRLKYAITAGVITIILILIFGSAKASSGMSIEAVEYNSNTLFMFIPIILTIMVAVKTGDIIIATIVGSVIGAITGISVGLFDFIQIDVVDAVKPALFTISGSGLDRTVGGIIQTGLSSMIQVIVLALLLFGSISVMRNGHGDIKLLNALNKVTNTRIGAELTISGMVISLSGLMGLNAPAILAVGSSFAKPLGEKHGISPYRIANLLDAQSNTFVYSLPWTPAMIYTLGFAADSKAPLAALDIAPFVFYAYAILVVMFVSILLGIGQNDNLGKSKKARKTAE